MKSEYRLGSRGTFLGRFILVKPSFSFQLCKFSDYENEGRFSLRVFFLWISLWCSKKPPHNIMDSWGFNYSGDSSTLHLMWGNKYKIIYMPWMFDHCITQVMLKDGTFTNYEKYEKTANGIQINPEPDVYRIKLPYRYELKSGKIQDRIATVTVERRQWCWKVCKALRWPSKTSTSIEVEFNDEVGEDSGSWKGGCIGCGYEMNPGELPIDCLARMERERKFK